MRPQDKKQFMQLMTDAMAFYRQDMSAFALSVWWQACERFDMEQVSKAITQHAMDPDRGQFAPKPADVVRLLQGTKTDRSLIAWGKVMDAMGAVGAYKSVVFDDPIIHAAVEDMGGWVKICRDELTGHTERRFCESYRAYASRPDATEYPALLPGEYELENRLEGRRVAPPVLIGNPKKAAEVLRLGGTGPKTQFTLATDAALSTLKIGVDA